MDQRTRFAALLAQMQDLYDVKNSDYGDEGPHANLYAVRALGLSPFVGVLVRMSDKMARLATFTRKGAYKVRGEGVRDTLLDLSIYSLLALILYEEEHPRG